MIWIATLLTLVASSFIRRCAATCKSSAIPCNAPSSGGSHAGRRAARHFAEFMKPPQIAGRWATDGTTNEWQFKDSALLISITDESAKIDINVAPDPLIRSLLMSQGVAEADAIALTDAILDWKDADTLKRARGAEDAEYEAAGLNYKPANAAFQSIEVKLVLGMTPALFEKLSPSSPSMRQPAGINSQIASREVLRALPGVTVRTD